MNQEIGENQQKKHFFERIYYYKYLYCSNFSLFLHRERESKGTSESPYFVDIIDQDYDRLRENIGDCRPRVGWNRFVYSKLQMHTYERGGALDR